MNEAIRKWMLGESATGHEDAMKALAVWIKEHSIERIL